MKIAESLKHLLMRALHSQEPALSELTGAIPIDAFARVVRHSLEKLGIKRLDPP